MQKLTEKYMNVMFT